MGYSMAKEIVMACRICGVEVRGSATTMAHMKSRGRAYCSPEHMRQGRYHQRETARPDVVMACVICGKEVRGSGTEMSRAKIRGRAYCSPEHAREWAARRTSEMRRIEVVLPCMICGKEVRGSGKEMSDAKRRARAYCSPEHKQQWLAQRMTEVGREVGARNAITSSERMKRNNPMRDPSVRAKQSATLRSMGWGPPKRGGNGRGPTVPQQLLASALGWPYEVVIGTGPGGRPKNYKLDIGNLDQKIAIEIDGSSHNSLLVQAADRRKEEWLRGRGWTVLRFSNAVVMERLEECVQTVSSTISKLKKPTPI